MKPVRVAIAGVGGRMGRMLVEAALEDPGIELAAAFVRPGSEWIGRDAGDPIGRSTGVLIGENPETAIAAADCVIDFTRPGVTVGLVRVAQRLGKSIVIGTTGFDAEQRALIEQAAKEIPIVLAPNMAVGVNVVFRLLEGAAALLGEGYDVEVIEAHHRNKVDAPSGTALEMGRILARVLGLDLEREAVYGRQGTVGVRPSRQIGFSAIRGGDIVGDHTVLFAGTGERIEITHRSQSRMPYAVGAMRAARFLQGRVPGLYDMRDVLGLR